MRHTRAARQFATAWLCGRRDAGRVGWLVVWVVSSFQSVGLGVAWLPPVADFFQMAVGAKFVDDAGSRAVANTRH